MTACSNELAYFDEWNKLDIRNVFYSKHIEKCLLSNKKSTSVTCKEFKFNFWIFSDARFCDLSIGTLFLGALGC